MSLGSEPDHVIIKFWGAPYILTDDGQPIFKAPFALRVRIPDLTDDKASMTIATKAVA